MPVAKLPQYSEKAFFNVRCSLPEGLALQILIDIVTKTILAKDWSKYNSIADFVNAAEDAGVVVPASIETIKTQSMELRKSRKIKLAEQEEDNEIAE